MNTKMQEIDVRTIAQHERHAQLFRRFDDLSPGDAFVIVNDHNPVPLRRQLEERTPGQVQWTYLQDGPQLWKVQIGRLPGGASPDDHNCCSGGACG